MDGARSVGNEAEVAAWVAGLRQLSGVAGALPLGMGFRKLKLTFRPDELHRVTTDDGCAIALARYHPRGERRYAEPVILCHGLGANRFTFDFDARYSLARRLAERGFEAWILELRGRGEAGKAAQSSFDHQVKHDVVAAMRTVLSTGAKNVLWVGHSKGGLLAFAHLGLNPGAPIRAVAAVGSPTTFTVQKGLKPFAKIARPLLAAPSVPIENLAKLALVVPPPDWFMRYLVHPENLDVEVRKRALANVGSDVSGGVGRQFIRWISEEKWDSEDGSFDYEKGLSSVRVPTLLIAGTKDLLAPPAAIAHTAGRVAGPTNVVIAGRDAGFREEYGHGDLMLGKHAPEELYPRIIEFLQAQGTVVAR